jgi:hypothetical protein
LEFIVEVSHGAQAAHHGFAAARDDEIAQEAREALDSDPVAVRLHRVSRHVDALLQREECLLVMTRRDGDDDPGEQLSRTPHHIFVAQRHGVESPGVYRDHVAGHGCFLLMQPLAAWFGGLCSRVRRPLQKVRVYCTGLQMAIERQAECGEFVISPPARCFEINDAAGP